MFYDQNSINSYMDRFKNIFSVFLFGLYIHSFSQNFSKKNTDCIAANEIAISNSFTYKSPLPSAGFGNILEVVRQNNKNLSEEHNSSWFLLTIGEDGELEFQITPIDSTNDYDFFLFDSVDSAFCQRFQNGNVNLLRSNLSNIKKTKKGVTGIKTLSYKNDVPKGIGEAFSSSIKVKKGEKYMLLIDNYTANGKGYTLSFDILIKTKIKGEILDNESKPLVANIELFDENGDKINETKSSSNGEYEFELWLKKGKNYYLTIISDSTFVETKIIKINNLGPANTYPNIKTVLRKLKKGEKYKLGNINFYGGSDELLPNSIPSIEALSKLMKINKKMIIQIEGHTNGEDWHLDEKYKSKREQILSEMRAQKIYDYLISKGIEEKRISIIGFGSNIPINKDVKNETQAMQNRRVEIKIITIKGDK